MRILRLLACTLLLPLMAAVATQAAPTVTVLTPVRQVLAPGQNLSLNVAATVTGATTYQWTRNGVSVGTNSATYSVASTTKADSGWYFVSVTDTTGTTRSATIFVTVAPTATQLYGWGVGTSGQDILPDEAQGDLAIAVGNNHALTLKRDGTVSAWGSNAFEQCDVPSGLSDAVAISAGFVYSIALKSDGTLVSWGAFNNNSSNVDNYSRSAIPSGLNNVVAVSAGRYHVLALKSDGSVRIWGDPNAADPNWVTQSAVPAAAGSGVVAVAAGNYFSLALKDTGTVLAWGQGTSGQTTIPGGLTGVVAVAAGASHALALKSDGTVVAWGSNSKGQRTVPGGLSGVVAIAAGELHSLAVKSDGTVVAWGDDTVGNQFYTHVPPDLQSALAVAGGENFSLALRDATGEIAPQITAEPAVIFGDPEEPFEADLPITVTAGDPLLHYQWYVATAAQPTVFTLVPDDDGNYFEVNTPLLAVIDPDSKATNTYVCRVFNGAGEATLGYVLNQWGAAGGPAITQQPSNQTAIEHIPPFLGTDALFSVTASGTGPLLYQWQIQQGGTGPWTDIAYDGTSLSSLNAEMEVVSPTYPADNGDRFRCVVRNALGTAISAPARLTVTQPQHPPTITSPNSVSLSASYTATASAGFGVFEWALVGTDSTASGAAINAASGVVSFTGLGTVVIKVRRAGDANHLASAYSSAFTITVNADGPPAVTSAPANRIVGVPGNDLSLAVTATTGYPPLTYQWKKNNRVLAGKTSATLLISSFTNADAGAYTLEISDSRGAVTQVTSFVMPNYGPTQVLAWGGQNTAGEITVPADLQNDVVAIAAGSATSYAIRADGSVRHWGYHPQPPPSLSGIVAIATGGAHSIALRSDGTVVEWGPTVTLGELITPPTLQGVVAVGAGGGFSVVLKSDGTVQAWGVNISGATDVPAGLSNVVELAVGYNHVIALRANGTFVGWGGDGESETSAPDGFDVSDAVELIAGDNTSAAIKADGSLVRWGSGPVYLSPAGLETVRAFSYGQLFHLALRSDGIAFVWGLNLYGSTEMPGVLNRVHAIAAGNMHSLVLRDATGDFAPSITADPVGQTVTVGDIVTMTVGATGDPAPAYQWKKNGTAVLGATGASYTISGVSTIFAGTYTVEVRSYLATLTSAPATLTVNKATQPAPVISSAPSVTFGTSYTATANSGVGARQWALGDGSTAAGAAINPSTGVITYTGTGTVVIKVRFAGDDDHEPSAYTNFTVTVNPAPVSFAPADFNGDGHADILWQNTTTGERVIWFMNGSTLTSSTSVNTIDPAWSIATTADFNADGQADIVWQNTTTGARLIWLMNGATLTSSVPLSTIDPVWSIATAADFNADDHPDILWQNITTGERVIWFMNGATLTSSAPLNTIDPVWSIAAAADFNADGHADIVWQNTTTGARLIWFMNGSTLTSSVPLNTIDPVWSIAATAADYNGDGHPDLLWQNTTTGARVIWFMNGSTLTSSASLTTIDPAWSFVGSTSNRRPAPPADFNGDGHADILWQNTTTGERVIWFMNGATLTSSTSLNTIDPAWSIATTADFNADGHPDLLWQNTTTGARLLWFMNGSTLTSSVPLSTIDPVWSIAAAADFNADDHPDILWQNTTTGARVIWFMNGSTLTSSVSLSTIDPVWSIAAAADFNADGHADIVWQNTTTGERLLWFMNGSTLTSSVPLGTFALSWSIVGTADFDADGHADIVWQNTATGERLIWFMNGSTLTVGTSMGNVPVEWSIAN